MRPRVLAIGLAVPVLAGCGGDGSGSGSDPFRTVSTVPASDRADRAAPRWERVTKLTGEGTRSEHEFAITRDAIQWRARYRCTSGTLTLRAGDDELVSAKCPRTGDAETVGSGRQRLQVEATGDWSAVIEQEVDSALREPPLKGMTPSRVLARGSFYDIERQGTGTALLYRLPGERLALRLEGFKTSANTDLFVWVSRTRRPTTTVQAFRSRHVEIAALKSTLGDENHLLPRGIEPADVRSVVIWCEPVRIAYTAATMRAR